MLDSILNAVKSDAEKIAEIEALAAQSQQKLQTVYFEIGRLYVALHGDDYEAPFKALFDEVHKVEGTVRECNRAVRDIKGVVGCEKCGSDVPKTSAFCSVCGHAMPGFEVPVLSQDYVVCSVCGKRVEASLRFCSACNMPLKTAFAPVEETVPPVEETVPPVEEIVAPVEEIVAPVEEIVAPVEEIVAPVEEIVPPVEDEVVPTEAPSCVQCGKPLKSGAAFCIHCGRKVEASAPAAAPAKRFCTQCGTAVSEQARFCTGCGKWL